MLRQAHACRAGTSMHLGTVETLITRVSGGLPVFLFGATRPKASVGKVGQFQLSHLPLAGQSLVRGGRLFLDLGESDRLINTYSSLV